MYMSVHTHTRENCWVGGCGHYGGFHPCDLMGRRHQLVNVRPGELLKQGHTAVGEAWLLGRSRFSSIKGRAREIEDSSVELAQ